MPSSLTDIYYDQEGYTINPEPIHPAFLAKTEYNKDRNNFIVDSKTGNIVMVLISDFVPKMKELISKLDVPKKMVQIEVLLFEKRLNRQTSYGLNLLRLGDAAKGEKQGGSTWNDPVAKTDGVAGRASGIFEFFFSRAQHKSFPSV